MVRNPWDWYVSWYAFNRKATMSNYLFLVLSDGGQLDFKSTVTNLVNLGDNTRQSEHYRNALISIIPETMEGNQGVGLTKSCIRNFSDNKTMIGSASSWGDPKVEALKSWVAEIAANDAEKLSL